MMDWKSQVVSDLSDGGFPAKISEAALLCAISRPIPMLLWCPECGRRHIDEGEFAKKSHHTHACQECGHVWRPAIEATVGVQFLPGFKNVMPNDQAQASRAAASRGAPCSAATPGEK
jgi:hypothetical protein